MGPLNQLTVLDLVRNRLVRVLFAIPHHVSIGIPSILLQLGYFRGKRRWGTTDRTLIGGCNRQPLHFIGELEGESARKFYCASVFTCDQDRLLFFAIFVEGTARDKFEFRLLTDVAVLFERIIPLPVILLFGEIIFLRISIIGAYLCILGRTRFWEQVSSSLKLTCQVAFIM